MPPAHQAMAKRTPDKLRTEAAALGLASGTYVDRLLDAREHPEQAVRACLGVLRLVGSYGKERLELPANAHSPPASPPRAISSGCSRPTGGTLSSMPTPRTAWASTAICGGRPTTTQLAAPIDAIPNRRE